MVGGKVTCGWNRGAGVPLHTVLMDPIEHFMLGNSPFMRYPYTQYMRPSGTVLGTPE